jgi:uncharacterized protein YecE (DUF72 family)
VIFDRDQVSDRLKELAVRNIYIGTSSWKYEGWIGQLYTPERYSYRGKVAKSRFEAGCLEEYAEVFKTVCVDAGFYRFPEERYVEKLAGQVPDGFKLSFKVTDEITLKNFPNQPRHGSRAGRANDNFLNTDLFTKAFLEPLSAHKEKIGVLMFEFGHLYKRDFAQGRDFVSALDEFLGQLPGGWQYGVEIRNKEFLRAEYFDVLRRYGVTHVFNSWSGMPPVDEQMAIEGSFTANFFSSRFLLRPGRKYAEAVTSFSPYESVQDPYPEGRKAIETLATKKPLAPSYIFVNNRLEGSALGTIDGVLSNLVS